MKFKLLKNYNGNPKGIIVEVSKQYEKYMLENGIGEPLEKPKPKKKAENKAIVPKYKKK